MVFQGLGISSTLCSRKYERTPVDDMFINPRGGGGGKITSPCRFCLSNSETLKAVTLAFCNIQ